ncbi:MAG: hypothetical protein AAGF85_17560 [Bacteroidota bacterium]
MTYKFESDKFAFSDNQLHLLRNKYNFRSFSNSEIHSISIRKGKQVNNWVVLLVLGMAMIGFSIYYALRLHYLLSEGIIRSIYVEEILIPLIPTMLGGYCVYSSVRNGIVATVILNSGKTYNFPLGSLSGNSATELEAYLSESGILKHKFKNEI